MTVELLISLGLMAIFLATLVYFESRSKRKHKQSVEESETILQTSAKCTNALHKKKYGRPSVELEQQFPELKAVK